MNGDASGTMVMTSSDPAGTVVIDSDDMEPRKKLETMAERGEDFAAALRSNAPAESSGWASPKTPLSAFRFTMQAGLTASLQSPWPPCRKSKIPASLGFLELYASASHGCSAYLKR